MDYKILEDLNKRRFNSPQVLHLIIFRALKILFFCLSLTFLFWFFLIQNYLLFTCLLGIGLGISAEMLVNSRRSRLKASYPETETYFTASKAQEETKVEVKNR